MTQTDTSAQADSSFRLIRTVKGDFTFFNVDNLGNLYAVNKSGQLKKFNPKGDSLGVFNDVRKYGRLYSIDASNPLKSILFYRDFRTIIVLDRLLNRVNTIDLRRQELMQIRAVGQSYDNNIWLFDEQDSRLKKIAEEGKILGETADLRLIFDQAPVPASIFDQDGFVYLYDPDKGIFVFDYYGAFKNKIPLTGWTNVQVIGRTVLGAKDGKFQSYTIGTLQQKEQPLPTIISQATQTRFSPQGIYVLIDGEIRLYNL
jgi:hypothetical protein